MTNPGRRPAYAPGMVRRTLTATHVAALVLAWFAGAWCFCGPVATAGGCDGRPPGACPACPRCPADGRSRTAPGGVGWCPIVSPAVPDRPAPAVDRPVAVAAVPGGPLDRPTVAAPVTGTGRGRRPPPRSLFDLHCSLLG